MIYENKNSRAFPSRNHTTRAPEEDFESPAASKAGDESIGNQSLSVGSLQVEVQQTESIGTTKPECDPVCRLQLERAQKYLGVPSGYRFSHQLLSWESKEKDIGGEFIAPVFGDGEEVTLICVECEPHPEKPDLISGVGVSILDTRCIFGVSPGAAASHWAAYIETRYLRTSEESFNGFSLGETEYASHKDLTKVLEQCFGVSYMMNKTRVNNLHNVVFVAVDASAIIAKIATLKFYIPEVAVDTIDPQDMARAVFREFEPRALDDLFSLYAIDKRSQSENAGDNSHRVLNLLLCIALEGSKDESMVGEQKGNQKGTEKRTLAEVKTQIARSADEYEISGELKRTRKLEGSDVVAKPELPAKRRKQSHSTPSMSTPSGIFSIEQAFAPADRSDQAHSTKVDVSNRPMTAADSRGGSSSNEENDEDLSIAPRDPAQMRAAIQLCLRPAKRLRWCPLERPKLAERVEEESTGSRKEE